MEPLKIDLTVDNKLDESYLRFWGSAIQSLLKALFGNYSIPVSIVGNEQQISAFANTLNSEKNYLQSYRDYGLNAAATYRNKYALNQAISQFERKTKLKWPFRS